ncbi:DUF3944 domain-containing protein [Serratia liquefaciens]|uniref:DUF3944 domain-containing protein n=1 Tax=Serratia liquefaciens TaxID=614 RepID=UPI00061B80BA|nr:DUF3944 domain-containing protein [Serratia liquefaciens]AKE08965.1 hypothetical protein XJ20_03260 [Serratia liquefaciens]
MAYRYDEDLEFLSKCSDEDLNGLVDCLIYDKDGETRWTEELSSNENYKRYKPQHSKYWRDIAAEIQCFGGNTVATMFRGGKGVEYREVLTDVCDKMKVNYNSKSSIENIEQCLMLKVLNDAFEKMSAEELKDFAREIGVKNLDGLTAKGLVSAFQIIFKAGGFKSYKLTLIIANAILKALIGRGLSFGGNILLTRSMAILTGPIGWALTALWTLIDAGGAAYRVTIPAVIQVAALRSQVSNAGSEELAAEITLD